MSLAFLLAACGFAAILGVLIALIDRWRESRLSVPHRVVAAPVVRVPTAPAPRKRAA
jgi:hypothetical protein